MFEQFFLGFVNVRTVQGYFFSKSSTTSIPGDIKILYEVHVIMAKLLALVVQTMGSAIHRINHYPADKHWQNQLSYPVDSDLSGR